MSYSEDIEKLENKINTLKPQVIDYLLEVENLEDFSEEVQIRLRLYEDRIEEQTKKINEIETINEYSPQIKTIENELQILIDKLKTTNEELYVEIGGKSDQILSSYLSGAIKQNTCIQPLIQYHNDIEILKEKIEKLKIESADKETFEFAKIKSQILFLQGKFKALTLQKFFVFKKVERSIVDEMKEDEIESPETKDFIKKIKLIRILIKDFENQYDDKILEQKNVIDKTNNLIKPNKINNYDETNEYIDELNDNLNNIEKELTIKKEEIFKTVLNTADYNGDVDNIKQVVKYKKDADLLKKIHAEEIQELDEVNTKNSFETDEDEESEDFIYNVIDWLSIFFTSSVLSFEFFIIGGIIWYSSSLLFACISVLFLWILFVVPATKPFIAFPLSFLWGWTGYNISEIFESESILWGIFLFFLAIILHAPSYIFRAKRWLDKL